MIAKRITRTSGDHFGRLARYLAAAGDEGEKLDRLWLAGCDAGPDGDAIDAVDLELAIAEIEATQALNTRTAGDKTYHLILSFRNDRPDDAALQDTERQFAAALGMDGHQRVVATHRNTENFHMHIAFNKVHPATLRCVTPFQDFKALETTCRAVERQYGLSVDNGREDVLQAMQATTGADRDNAPPLSPAARDFEAHRWEVSFERYVKERLPALEAARRDAAGWQDLHAAFADEGLRLRLRGNGLVITDARGRQRIKASALGRQFSKPACAGRRRRRSAGSPSRKRSRLIRSVRPPAEASAAASPHSGPFPAWPRLLCLSSDRAPCPDCLAGRPDDDPAALAGALLVFDSWRSVCILCASQSFTAGRLNSSSLLFNSASLSCGFRVLTPSSPPQGSAGAMSAMQAVSRVT
jgi:hypothetical protein